MQSRQPVKLTKSQDRKVQRKHMLSNNAHLNLLNISSVFYQYSYHIHVTILRSNVQSCLIILTKQKHPFCYASSRIEQSVNRTLTKNFSFTFTVETRSNCLISSTSPSSAELYKRFDVDDIFLKRPAAVDPCFVSDLIIICRYILLSLYYAINTII